MKKYNDFFNREFKKVKREFKKERLFWDRCDFSVIPFNFKSYYCLPNVVGDALGWNHLSCHVVFNVKL